jgi:hypothetical protein
MAKKKKRVAIPSLRKDLRETIRDLEGLQKDLVKVQANLERFLNRPRVGGEDEWLADLRALTRQRR